MRSFALPALCLALASQPLWGQETTPPAADTVTVSRAEWEALKATVEALQADVERLKAAAPAAAPAEATPSEPGPEPAGGGRSLLLPDISFIAQAKGLLSSDRRDENRNKLQISEAEIGIQGYVYPNVKADAFIAMSPLEGVSAQVEEAYLTYLGLGKGLNLNIGQKHVPFGRTNLTHSHSWLYVDQPLALQNLVAEESLVGAGVGASYLLPTSGDLFAQLDLGYWTPAGHHHEEGEEGEGEGILRGPGAEFHDHFATSRLWASKPLGRSGELEVGGSYAQGAGHGAEGTVRLAGADLSYRHYGEGSRRLLLRAEGVARRQAGSTAQGYYLLADQRLDKHREIGLLYDWSEFPQAPGEHESALSLIGTHQFSEQYYLRLQLTHGNRPGNGAYNEARLQWVWGVGPHTHNLE